MRYKWKYELHKGFKQQVCLIKDKNYILTLFFFYERYSKGFGIVGKLLGEKSPLNISNSITGLMFYALQIILSKFIIITI
jgi:hypothetical protein